MYVKRLRTSKHLDYARLYVVLICVELKFVYKSIKLVFISILCISKFLLGLR